MKKTYKEYVEELTYAEQCECYQKALASLPLEEQRNIKAMVELIIGEVKDGNKHSQMSPDGALSILVAAASWTRDSLPSWPEIRITE